MSRESTQDKLYLLMEETGCDQLQAELAMASAGYDLEKAIRAIGALLRDLVAVRARFVLPDRNFYGLVLLVVDVKRRTVRRARAVISYNPAVYETPLSGHWYDFEKSLYAFRLWEGTLQQATQELERRFLDRLQTAEEGLLDLMQEGREAALKERVAATVAGAFAGAKPEMELFREELNLDQYQRFKTEEASPSPDSADRPASGEANGAVLLNIDLETHPEGVRPEEIKPGDSVHVLITDERDIAQYLSKLLGGRPSDKPLPAPVEECRREGDHFSFHVRLSAGILGLASVPAAASLRVQRLESPSWWKRLLPEF